MTCAKCGISIDSSAGEKQEAVRGRVKEKPEVVIDPSLPNAPSKFPLVPAILAIVVLLGGIVGVIAYRELRPPELTEEQRARIAALAKAQKAWGTLWDESPLAHQWFSCRHLDEVVRRPCKDTVDPSKLAFEPAMLALATPDSELFPDSKACGDAVLRFLKSRIDARCD